MAEKTGMSRRAFVGLGTTALAAAGMGLAGCAAQPNNAGAKDEPSEETTWRTAPEPIADSEIAETITADVVVVGAGHAGTAATRALAEAGVSVVCIEEQSEENFMMIGNDIGHINSEYLASQGVPKVDEQEFFHNWMVNSGHRANADLVMKFTKNCGQAFDWWLEPLSDEQIASINVDFWPETEHTLHELNTGLKYWIGTPQLYAK